LYQVQNNMLNYNFQIDPYFSFCVKSGEREETSHSLSLDFRGEFNRDEFK